MTVYWKTLLTDEQGLIDYVRVRAFGTVLIGILGGVATVLAVFIPHDINETLVAIMVTACVLPLTGGKIGDAIARRREARATAEVRAGDAPGRRASDPAMPPLPG